MRQVTGSEVSREPQTDLSIDIGAGALIRGACGRTKLH